MAEVGESTPLLPQTAPRQQAEQRREENVPEATSTLGLCSVYLPLFIVVELMLLARAGLLMTRFGTIGLHCNDTLPIHKDPEFLFTTAAYGVVSIVRVLEYLVLGIGIFNAWFEFNGKIHFSWHVSGKRVCGAIVMLLYLALGVAVPVLGIFQELDYADDIHCPRHNAAIYYAYCGMNFVKNQLGFAARIMLIIAMQTIHKIWSADDTHTRDLYPPRDTVVNIKQDWKYTSLHHSKLTRKYEERGKQVQALTNIFKVWFLFPWIAYILVSSLQTYNLVKPWTHSGVERSTWEWPTVYLLVYNFHQLFAILIPYLCGQRINSYHQKFYRRMREDQLHKFSAHASRFAYARTQLIEKDTEFDFIPRVLGTSIEVRMDSPLYVIILLLGLLFTMIDTLLRKEPTTIY